MEFLEFITKYYMNLIRQHSASDIEKKVKTYELKRFVFRFIVEEAIAMVAKNCGTDELSEVGNLYISYLQTNLLTSR